MQEHSFGHWLKLRRKALDLTQAELASQVGCSAAAIRKIEAEERRPSVQAAQRLAEIFNIPQGEQKNFLRFARGGLRSAPAEVIKEFPWHMVTRLPRTNLPAPVTSLIGRAEEIEGVNDYLLRPDTRLITLMGPPGIGKTRLSIEAARAVLPDFPDGVFFVALTPLEDPSLLAPTIAQALEYIETKVQPVSKQLVESIGDKRMLLVLDNCEHLVEHVSRLAATLLSACSRLKILATSRESLRISGEWLYPLPPLNSPKEHSSVDMDTASQFPALMLFAERARAVHPNFALHPGNLQAVASICAHLDGLPLAIELMAARMRLISPYALLAHLNSHYVLSADGPRSMSTRQKTLNDTLSWSYNLLSEAEQRLFAYLSVFPGGFTAEMVETIFSPLFAGTSVSALITSLSDKSLLQRAFDAHSQTRFSMLVTIQAFALNCLQAMKEEADAHNKHLKYFLDLSERADRELRGLHQAAWLSHLGAERDNLRSALEWAIETRQIEAALRLTCRLDWFWFVRSDHTEGRHWLEGVLALPEASLHPELYAEALTQLAHHLWLQIGPIEARPPVEKALAVTHENEDKHNTAKALAILGLVLIDEQDFGAAHATLEESKALFREVRDDWGYAHAMMSLTLAPYRQDDRVTALSLYEQVLELFRKLGDMYFQSVALRLIGILKVELGNVTTGEAALQEALTLSRQLDSKYEIAAELWAFGRAAEASGKLTRAVRLYSASRTIFDSIGAWPGHDVDENSLATYHTELGEPAFTAAVEVGRAMTMDQAIAYALKDEDGIAQ
jgi:predicted ATPase/DNA-binding XRE family transcriptional regulator